MSKNLKVIILLLASVVGAAIGHYYQPAEPQPIIMGALVGAFLANWIIGMAD